MTITKRVASRNAALISRDSTFWGFYRSWVEESIPSGKKSFSRRGAVFKVESLFTAPNKKENLKKKKQSTSGSRKEKKRFRANHRDLVKKKISKKLKLKLN